MANPENPNANETVDPRLEKLAPAMRDIWPNLSQEEREALLAKTANREIVSKKVEVSSTENKNFVHEKTSRETKTLENQVVPVMAEQKAKAIEETDGLPMTEENIAKRNALIGEAQTIFATQEGALMAREKAKLKESGDNDLTIVSKKGFETPIKNKDLAPKDQRETQQQDEEVKFAFYREMNKLGSDSPVRERMEQLVIERGEQPILRAFGAALKADAQWNDTNFRENPTQDADGDWRLAANAESLGKLMHTFYDYEQAHAGEGFDLETALVTPTLRDNLMADLQKFRAAQQAQKESGMASNAEPNAPRPPAEVGGGGAGAPIATALAA